MRTLALADGDLVVQAGGHATIGGAAKLRHDLGLAAREPYGSDRFHPGWGSTLHNLIGGPVGPGTRALIEGEIARLVRNLAIVQATQLQSDAMEGRRPSYSGHQVISSLGDIEVTQDIDQLRVRAHVHVVSGQSVTVETGVVL